MTLISREEKAVIRKDFGEIWDSKMARSTMLVVPVVMVIFFPIFFLVLISTIPTDQINGVEQMMKMLPAEAKDFGIRQSMFYLMTNVISPMFFLMIPLMASSVSAASSFVGEKERGTLVTLLLTPLGIKRIFKSKVLGCIALSAVTTAISFLLFAVIVSAGDIILGMPFFLNWRWLVLILFLSPAATVFGVIFMVLVSGKSRSYIESIQASSYIIVPVVLLFLSQLVGSFVLGAPILLVISAILMAVDILLWILASRSFTPEKLLR